MDSVQSAVADGHPDDVTCRERQGHEQVAAGEEPGTDEKAPPVASATKLLVWVRAGGRCVICNEYLLFDHFEDGSAVRRIGEVAHVAGESVKGPRGDSLVPVPDRADAANLILLCPTEHRAADKRRLFDPLFTEAYLYKRKKEHEAFVQFVTGLRDEGRTVIVRMHGDVRDVVAPVSRTDAALAAMTHSRRTPCYMPDPHGVGPEIDLHNIPGPVTAEYWSAALRQIDAQIERVHAKAKEDAAHLSIFAIALVPLLIAFGNRLDNTINADIYERRHASTEPWVWDPEAPTIEFNVTEPEALAGAAEGVLIVNASGTVDQTALPAGLVELPRIVLAPAGGVTAGQSAFENAATLKSFKAAVHRLFERLELPATRAVRRLHVLGAVPVSAAVELGRSLPVNNAAPRLVLYHLHDGSYVHAFDIPRTGEHR